MERLLTTEEVAEMYGVSAYTITQNWCNKGLKHIKSKTFMFKQKWVDDYLELESERHSQAKTFYRPKVQNITISSNLLKRTFNKEMKIV